MRVALCMSGEMRGTPDCVSELMANVYKPFKDAGAEVDLFVHTRLDPWWRPAADLPFRMLHVERNAKMSDEEIVNEINPPGKGRFGPGLPTNNRRAFLYQSYLQYYRSLASVAELKRRAEEQDGKLYDWVARIRPDSHPQDPIKIEDLTEQAIYVPENDRWKHNDAQGREMVTLSDKFAIGPSKMMDMYFDRRSYVKEFCQIAEIQAEALVVWQLARAGVPWKLLPGCVVLRDKHVTYENSFRPDREDC